MPRTVHIEELFKGRHFDQEIVVLCVRWYLSYKLRYRDLAAMMGERGIAVAHTTRWVQHYTRDFEKHWNRYALSVGGSWRCDETYIKAKGAWVYLYRAVDKAGKTVDFYLSRNRDVARPKRFYASDAPTAASDRSRLMPMPLPTARWPTCKRPASCRSAFGCRAVNT
jgi:transposase-like protein